MTRFKTNVFGHHRGGGQGKLYLVGIGPGAPGHRTRNAETAIKTSEVVVGYTPYVDSLADILDGQELVTSGMRKEKERCRVALQRAEAGQIVSLVSSGDAGIYGMAGLAMEMAHRSRDRIAMEVIPGVTAATAAAAHLGAPLMADFATLSLSDLLIPWSVIEKRLYAVAQADLVTCLYNPRSNTRSTPLKKAIEIFRQFRAPDTIVGLVRNAGREDCAITLTQLDALDEAGVDMHTTVLIGNAQGYLAGDNWVTRRGYTP